MTKRIALIKKRYQELDIQEMDVVFMNGKVAVSKDFLTYFYGMKTTGVQDWFKKKTTPVIPDFETSWVYLHEIMAWHDKNINKTKSNRAKLQFQDKDKKLDLDDTKFNDSFMNTLNEEERDAFLSSGKDPLDMLKDLKEIQKKDIANKVSRGELVKKEEVEKAMVELVLIQKGMYRDDERTIFAKLGIKPTNRQKEILNQHYVSRFVTLRNIARSKWEKKITDIFAIVQDKLSKYSVSEIIEKLNEL